MKSLKLFLISAIAMAGILAATSCKGDEQKTIAVTDVELDETSLSLKVGETAELMAFVSPSNATDRSIKWTSDNEEVATVKGGKITAKAKGEAVITAAATDGSGIEATCLVTVTDGSTPPPTKTITVGEMISNVVSDGFGYSDYPVTVTEFPDGYYEDKLVLRGAPEGISIYNGFEIIVGAGTMQLQYNEALVAGGTYTMNLSMDNGETWSNDFTLVVGSEANAPTVTITNSSWGNLSGTSGYIIMTAMISSDGGSAITERGMEVEEMYNGWPTPISTYKDDEAGTGEFTISTSYGMQGESLRFRAYAINEAGTKGYSEWKDVN